MSLYLYNILADYWLEVVLSIYLCRDTGLYLVWWPLHLAGNFVSRVYYTLSGIWYLVSSAARYRLAPLIPTALTSCTTEVPKTELGFETAVTLREAFKKKKNRGFSEFGTISLRTPPPYQIVKNIIVKIGPYSWYPPSQ